MPFDTIPAADISASAKGTLGELERIVRDAPTENTGTLAASIKQQTGDIAKGLMSKLSGGGAGAEAMADKIYRVIDRVQEVKNASWKALGDARDDSFVSAGPLHNGQIDVRALHASSAMPDATGKSILDEINGTFSRLYSGAEAGNKAAQATIRAKQRALMMGGFDDAPINVSQPIKQHEVRIGDLRQVYRELNDMWRRTDNASEKLLIGKYKKAINDTLDQDKEFASLWDAAKKENCRLPRTRLTQTVLTQKRSICQTQTKGRLIWQTTYVRFSRGPSNQTRQMNLVIFFRSTHPQKNFKHYSKVLWRTQSTTKHGRPALHQKRLCVTFVQPVGS